MKILAVSQTFFPFLDEGGRPAKVGAISRHLINRGHSLTVLTSSLDRSRASGTTHVDGAEVVYLPSLFRYRSITLDTGIASFCRRRLRDFDVVHIYGLYDFLGPGVAHYCRAYRVPYLVEPLGMFRPLVRNLFAKRAYHHLFGRKMLAGAAVIVATSGQERDELLAGGIPASKIILRRNGLDFPSLLPAPGVFRAKSKIPSGAKIILFLGRLVAKKSPDMLIEAFARWQTTPGAPPAALVLAGPGEGDGYLERLHNLVYQFGLAGRVHFTGPLFGDDKWSAYRDADLFVLPSQNENFGNTAAEAVAAGTPVILTDQCGIAPWIAPRAGIVIPHRLEALEAAIAHVFADATLHERLRSACREVAESLSWDEPIAQQLDVYRRVIDGQRKQASDASELVAGR